MITSFFPGHLRLRSPALKDTVVTDKVFAILQQFPAIKRIEHNQTAGSILLEYNTAQVPAESLQPLLPVLKKLEKAASAYSEKTKPAILTVLDELESCFTHLQINNPDACVGLLNPPHE